MGKKVQKALPNCAYFQKTFSLLKVEPIPLLIPAQMCIRDRINSVYNGTKITIAVLDNSTTAMTGHQPHPGTGRTMMGQEHGKGDIAAIAKACGVAFVATVNPLDLPQAVAMIKEAIAHPGVSLILFQSPCIAVAPKGPVHQINENCTACGSCIREIGCPAMYQTATGVGIDATLCYGCGLCRQVCPFDAINGGENA